MSGVCLPHSHCGLCPPYRAHTLVVTEVWWLFTIFLLPLLPKRRIEQGLKPFFLPPNPLAQLLP